MKHPAALALAAVLAGVVLAQIGPTAPGPATPATPAAPVPTPSGPLPEPSPAASVGPSAPSPSVDPQPEPDSGAPTTTGGGSSSPGRPGLDGAPDPAELPIPATPRTTPNLGDERHLQPVTTLGPLPESPVISGPGFSGAKVDLIQRTFGIERTIGVTDAETIAAIVDFQERHGLEPSGDVGPATWSAMFPDVSWEIDRYRTRPVLPLDAPAEARIEQMIRYIRTEALGARYVWGAAGPFDRGYDCSGLMLQAMYSAGIDPQPINVVDHQRPRYPTAQKLYNYDGFLHVPVDEARRGDLVFYGPADNPERITHVALVLGNGYVLEALPGSGVSQDRFYERYRGGAYEIRPEAVRVVG
nr:hypothetical protein [Propionibacterium sp.]